jgi:hypothetical protein
LTCRANHRHNAIIAKIAKARTEKSVAGFLFGNSRIGRRPHIDAATPNAPAGRRERAAVRTLTQLAGMREHVGLRRGSPPPHAAPDGIRFAPQMIRSCTAIMPHFSISGEMPMTGYLISLALIGLIVIAVSEEVS